MIEIIVHKIKTAQGVKLQLWTKNWPKNFLGMGFDLNLESVTGDYLGMDFGPVMEKLKADQLPLKLVKYIPESNKLVVGISFKAQNLPTLDDGLLATFNYSGDLTIINLENKVYSIYQGRRVDLNDVVWTIAQEKAQVAEVTNVLVQPARKVLAGQSSNPVQSIEIIDNTELSTSLDVDPAVVAVLNKSVSQSEYGFNWYLLIGIVLVLIIVLAYLFRRYFLRLINKENKSIRLKSDFA